MPDTSHESQKSASPVHAHTVGSEDDGSVARSEFVDGFFIYRLIGCAFACRRRTELTSFRIYFALFWIRIKPGPVPVGK